MKDQLKQLTEKLRNYILATKPWSLTVVFGSALLGTCLALKDTGTVDSFVFVLQSVCQISIQALANLINNYADYVNGVDGPDSSDRTLVDGLLQPTEVLWLAAAAISVSAASFAALLASFDDIRAALILLALYAIGLSASYLYTAGFRLKYVALGDILIFVMFGPFSVSFSYYVHYINEGITNSRGHNYPSISDLAEVVTYSLPLGLTTTAILHSNNARDAVSDAKAGIKTVAILLGRRYSYFYFQALLFSPFLAFAVLVIFRSSWFLLPMLTFFSAFRCTRRFQLGLFQELPENVAQLHLWQTLLYVAAWVSETLVFQ